MAPRWRKARASVAWATRTTSRKKTTKPPRPSCGTRRVRSIQTWFASWLIGRPKSHVIVSSADFERQLEPFQLSTGRNQVSRINRPPVQRKRSLTSHVTRLIGSPNHVTCEIIFVLIGGNVNRGSRDLPFFLHFPLYTILSIICLSTCALWRCNNTAFQKKLSWNLRLLALFGLKVKNRKVYFKFKLASR